MPKNKINLELIGHLLAAFALLLKGYDKIGHGHLAIGATLMLAGAIVVVFMIYAQRTGRGHRIASALVFLFEALAMALITYFYIEEGKHVVQYATLLAAAAYLFAFVRTLVTSRQHWIKLNDVTTGAP